MPLPLATLVTDLGEPARHDDQTADALERAVHDHVGDHLGPDRDHSQVDRALDVTNRRVRRYAVDLVRLGVGVHREQPTGESAVAQVPQQRVADRALATAGSDHGHTGRGQQPGDRQRLRTLLPGLHHPERGVGRRDVELDHDHAVLELPGHLVAGLGEDGDHLPVVGQHLGDEPGDAVLPSRLGQVLEQQLPEAPPLVRVLDQEGDLGGPPAGPLVPADADHLVADRHDQRESVHVVDLGEPRHVAVRQLRVGREEAVVLRLLRDARVELDQQVRVTRRDRSQMRRSPIAQDYVGLVHRRIPLGILDDVLSRSLTPLRRCHAASVLKPLLPPSEFPPIGASGRSG